MKKINISNSTVIKMAKVDESTLNMSNTNKFGCRNVECCCIECEDCIFESKDITKDEFMKLIVEED